MSETSEKADLNPDKEFTLCGLRRPREWEREMVFPHEEKLFNRLTASINQRFTLQSGKHGEGKPLPKTIMQRGVSK